MASKHNGQFGLNPQRSRGQPCPDHTSAFRSRFQAHLRSPTPALRLAGQPGRPRRRQSSQACLLGSCSYIWQSLTPATPVTQAYPRTMRRLMTTPLVSGRMRRTSWCTSRVDQKKRRFPLLLWTSEIQNAQMVSRNLADGCYKAIAYDGSCAT